MKVLLVLSLLLGSTLSQDDWKYIWNVSGVEGFPTVDFSEENKGGEILFNYTYTGELTAQKTLSWSILQWNCSLDAPGDGTVFIVNPNTDRPGYLDFEVDIDFENVASSQAHYVNYTWDSNPDDTQVYNEINFCARVDYNYVNLLGEVESITFHEWRVRVQLQMTTSGFSIKYIETERIAADVTNENEKFDTPVIAYYCDDNNNKVAPGTYAQGDFLQFCLRHDETAQVGEIVYVEDVWSLSISQPLGPGTPTTSIRRSRTDLATQKICADSGFCNVKAYLPSKFFVDEFPNDLKIEGIALLAFGYPSNPPRGGRRQLRRANILLRGAASARRFLQEEASDSTNGTAFGLDVSLGSSAPAFETNIYKTLTVGVLILLVVFLILCYLRKGKEDEKYDGRH